MECETIDISDIKEYDDFDESGHDYVEIQIYKKTAKNKVYQWVANTSELTRKKD